MQRKTECDLVEELFNSQIQGGKERDSQQIKLFPVAFPNDNLNFLIILRQKNTSFTTARCLDFIENLN